MLRELKMNEMEMVSGGFIDGQRDPWLESIGGGSGDEIVVTQMTYTGVGLRNLVSSALDSSMSSWTGAITNGLISSGIDVHANFRNQLADLHRDIQNLQTIVDQQQIALNFLMEHTHEADSFMENFEDGLGGGNHNPANPPNQ